MPNYECRTCSLETDVEYDNLSDIELLAILLGVNEAKRLYKGALLPLFFPPSVSGHSHKKLVAAHALVKRLLLEEVKHGPALAQPNSVKQYLKALLAGRDRECFVVLFLDNQHRVITTEIVAEGTIDAASVYPREVVKMALRFRAAATIFAHNHPSGVTEPSTADRLLTDRLKEALRMIDIRVLDHFVVGGPDAVSFAERGLL